MFGFIKKWNLKRKLEKRHNRKISDSYINEQKRIYQRRFDSNANDIDVMNYMLLNNIINFNEESRVSSHSNREEYNSSYVEFKHNSKNEDNHTRHDTGHSRRDDEYESTSRHYCGGGHSSHDSGGGSCGGGGGGD